MDGVEETLGTFTNEERYEKHAVWYLKEETEVTFHVEGGFERNAEGVAAGKFLSLAFHLTSSRRAGDLTA